MPLIHRRDRKRAQEIEKEKDREKEREVMVLLSHLDSISPLSQPLPRINTVFVVELAHHCCLSKGRCMAAREIERASVRRVAVGLLVVVVAVVAGNQQSVRLKQPHWPTGRRHRRDGKTQEESRGNVQSGGDPVQSLRVCVRGGAALKEHRGGTGEGVLVHV